MEKKCIGVDVGGTTVKIGLFEVSGELLKKWEIPTRKEEQGKYILDDVAASLGSETQVHSKIIISSFTEKTKLKKW